MQFGLQLPTYWSDYGSSNVREAVEESARTAAALGYASLWVNDHVITSPDRAGVGYILEPLITLASLIHLVPDLDLGTSVLVLPQRNGIVVAKQAAALDVLSNGRLILGVGVGWNEGEFRFLDADFRQRGAVADEAIEAMRVLWREPQASYHGRFYDFSDAVFFPKPARNGPPLWIGGNTPPAIRRAARYGHAWSPFGIGLDAFRDGAAQLRELCQDRPAPTLAAHLMLYIQPRGGVASSQAQNAHLSGTPEQIAAILAQYRQAGLQYLICGFEAAGMADFLRQVRTFAGEIAPEF